MWTGSDGALAGWSVTRRALECVLCMGPMVIGLVAVRGGEFDPVGLGGKLQEPVRYSAATGYVPAAIDLQPHLVLFEPRQREGFIG